MSAPWRQVSCLSWALWLHRQRSARCRVNSWIPLRLPASKEVPRGLCPWMSTPCVIPSRTASGLRMHQKWWHMMFEPLSNTTLLVLGGANCHATRALSSPLGTLTQRGTEAPSPAACEWQPCLTIMRVSHPAGASSSLSSHLTSDDASIWQMLEGDPEPELHSWAVLRFLTHRNHEKEKLSLLVA